MGTSFRSMDCWQNSPPSGYRTKVLIFLLWLLNVLRSWRPHVLTCYVAQSMLAYFSKADRKISLCSQLRWCRRLYNIITEVTTSSFLQVQLTFKCENYIQGARILWIILEVCLPYCSNLMSATSRKSFPLVLRT